MAHGRQPKPKPLYQNVMDDILTAIDSGGFSFDKPICTESGLMDKYGYSRITVRRGGLGKRRGQAVRIHMAVQYIAHQPRSHVSVGQRLSAGARLLWLGIHYRGRGRKEKQHGAEPPCAYRRGGHCVLSAQKRYTHRPAKPICIQKSPRGNNGHAQRLFVSAQRDQ